MLFNKRFNNIAAMPTGAINVQPDSVTVQSPIQMPQNFKKSVSIAFFRTNHSVAAKKRSNPAGHVQALTMLTRSQDAQPDALFGPAATKTGVKRKPRLILKNNRLFRPQTAEFFLTCARTFEHLPISLECMNNLRVSTGTPDDASISGPDELSDLYQSASLGGQPQSDRPIALDSGQNPEESSLNERPEFSEPYSSVSLGVRNEAWALRTLSRLRSRRVTSGSNSSASDRRRRLSNTVVALQEPKARQQSLTRSTLQESCRPTLKGFLSSLLSALGLVGDFSCFKYTIKIPLCHFI